ncbi:hypothetical protein [Colwellia psychrerythraea]|uniref:Putative lipoprotein n=1 Tax=Colwellia psychrerythraea (strain 34H / ATCC BAA-681) TaxID=167879 RepID=Q484J3_COLP3|nr:hypothetical protein [Colwellia psychrerythraea]AAZ24628.1 putative lipoprotein [Colwellia psychrerythraea 34H]
MKIKTILLLAATTFLTACSTPEEQAKSLIADYCDAFKSNDIDTLKTLTNDPNLAEYNLMSDSERKSTTCGKKVKKLSEDKYIFLLGDKVFSLPIVVEKVDGDFIITGVNI